MEGAIVNQGSFEALKPLPAGPGAEVCEFSSAEITITRYDLDAEIEVELTGAGGSGERIVMVARGELVLSADDAATEPLKPGDWAVLKAESNITAMSGASGASLVVTGPR